MSEFRRSLLMQKIEQGPLPKEYQQVAYIGSTYGDYQELDIDYYPTPSEEEYNITCKILDSNSYYIYGCGISGSYVHIGNSGGSFYRMRIRNSSGGNHTIDITSISPIDNYTIYTFISSYSGFFIKDYSTDTIVAQKTGSYNRWTGPACPYSLKIFTWGCQKHELWCTMEFYGFQINDIATGELRVNLIPCVRKSDNKPGVYDTVRKRFFVNGGTKNDFYYQQ